MRDNAGNNREFGQVSRRAFAAVGAAGAFAALTGTAGATPLKVAATRVTVATPSGSVGGLFIAAGEGRHPGVVMWAAPDAEPIARNLAERGFAVLLVDSSRHAAADPRSINREAKALVAWLADQPAVDRARTVPGSAGIGNGYVLRSVSAARPALSLATRAERKSAAACGMLFALPELAVARSPARMGAINDSARIALHAQVRAAA